MFAKQLEDLLEFGGWSYNLIIDVQKECCWSGVLTLKDTYTNPLGVSFTVGGCADPEDVCNKMISNIRTVSMGLSELYGR